MSGRADTSQPEDSASVKRVFETRAKAELAAADALAPGSDAVAWRGALLADVAVVKGAPGPAEASGMPALSGADGDAAVKALEKLGYAADALFFTLSRPEPGLSPEQRAERLRSQIEAVDPQLVIALDSRAAEDVAVAFGIAAPRFGEIVEVLGRRVLAVDGLEASLGDEAHKRRVWKQLQAGRPTGPVY